MASPEYPSQVLLPWAAPVGGTLEGGPLLPRTLSLVWKPFVTMHPILNPGSYPSSPESEFLPRQLGWQLGFSKTVDLQAHWSLTPGLGALTLPQALSRTLPYVDRYSHFYQLSKSPTPEPWALVCLPLNPLATTHLPTAVTFIPPMSPHVHTPSPQPASSSHALARTWKPSRKITEAL